MKSWRGVLLVGLAAAALAPTPYVPSARAQLPDTAQAADYRPQQTFASHREPWQADSACGPNCLYVFLRAHGRPVEHDQLLSETRLGKKGLSLQALEEYARGRGLEVEVVKGKPASLDELPLPAVAHMGPGYNDHFVVLCEMRGSQVRIVDGTMGASFTMDRARFEQDWSGYLLAVRQVRFASLADLALYLGPSVCLLGVGWYIRTGNARKSQASS